ncbi:MAG: hypothetical protein J0L92_17600 [Deltaproteobacteria bacterium]|nr:hypothetical protein [Deltaproteobacteria bacterium]
MAPFDRRRAELAYEAARVERARLITLTLASAFETLARFFRDMSGRAPTPPADLDAMTPV